MFAFHELAPTAADTLCGEGLLFLALPRHRGLFRQLTASKTKGQPRQQTGPVSKRIDEQNEDGPQIDRHQHSMLVFWTAPQPEQKWLLRAYTPLVGRHRLLGEKYFSEPWFSGGIIIINLPLVAKSIFSVLLESANSAFNRHSQWRGDPKYEVLFCFFFLPCLCLLFIVISVRLD